MENLTSDKRPRTAIIYVRVSSEEQTYNFSLAGQEKSCRELANREGLKILEIFREEGVSAKTLGRPALARMQRYCLSNRDKVGYLIIYKVDRFARNSLDYHTIRKFFKDYGVELKSATENIENTPQGKFSESILAAQAEYDNAVRSERTTAGMRMRASEGYWPTGAPWGYKNIIVNERKIIIPHPERAPIVKFIYEEYSRGTITFRELARKIRKTTNARSKHDLQISKQLVYRILRNPAYYGRVVIPKLGVDVLGKHTPIISEELYEQTQWIMRGGDKSRKAPRNRNNPDFPLRGLKCGYCWRHMTGGFVKGRTKKYAYYSCINPECPKKGSVAKEIFERDFTEYVRNITPNDAVLNALVETLLVVHERTQKENVTEALKIKRTLKKLEKGLENLLELRMDGVIDNVDYMTQAAKRKNNIREMEERYRELGNPESSVDSMLEFAVGVVRDFQNQWKELEPGELRVLLPLFFPQNLEYQYPGFKTAELSPIYKVKTPSDGGSNRLVTLQRIEL